MSLVLRTAIPDQDYGRLAPLLNTEWIDAPVTAAMLNEWDARMPKEQIARRSIAVTQSAEVVGYAEVMYLPWKPVGHFWLWLMVHPERRNEGIGRALYDDALQFAQTSGATFLESNVKEFESEGLRFAEQQGFNIERREFDSTLNVKSFDDSRFAGVIEAVEATGIRYK